MPDVFARLAARLRSETSSGPRPLWPEPEDVLLPLTEHARDSSAPASASPSAPTVTAPAVFARTDRPAPTASAPIPEPTPVPAPVEPHPAPLSSPTPRTMTRPIASRGDAHTRAQPAALRTESLPREAPPPANLGEAIRFLRPGTEPTRRTEPVSGASGRPSEEIVVEIGQLIVHPAPPNSAAPRRSAPEPAGSLSLSDYLAGRR